MSTEKILHTALEAARIAGQRARNIRFSPDFKVHTKSDRSLVTEGDLASEKIIKEIVSANFPDHMFLGEESAGSWSAGNFMADHLWVVDPVDGTTNYVYGLPHSAVSVAYASKGQVQAAVVYNLFNQEIFHAVKGQGAYLNNQPIHCNEITQIQDCLVATGLPYRRPIPASLERQLISVANNCRDIKRLGAASLDLCYVACGRLDAYFESVAPWDIAAGSLIVREAGGKVLNFNLSDDQKSLPSDLNGKNLLAVCPGICEQMLGLLI